MRLALKVTGKKEQYGTGLRQFATPALATRWARSFFFASLIYLPALIAALVADVLVL